MSNHFSAANLKSPGDDPRLDLTDLFVFPSTADQDKTILIMDSNPFMAAGSTFHPDAVYRINVDTNGDIQPDLAFSFMFTDPAEGPQTATAIYSESAAHARQAEPAGELLIASTPVGFDGTAQPCMAARAVLRRAQRPVLRRHRRRSARIQVDRTRRVRGQERALDRDGSSERHARPRPGYRRVGHYQPAP